MLHIYRQIVSLQRVRPVVIAQKRENADRFRFQEIRVVKKPPLHFLRRIWFKQIADRPWKISARQTHTLLGLLTDVDAQLLHVYFGHIAVLLLPLLETWSKPSLVSFHGADVLVDMHKPAYRRATQQMLAAVKGVLVRSESLRRAVTELGCPPEKIEIQRTGIPLDTFPFRERPSPRNGEWRLLQAGRLIEKKGIATTLRAFAKFHEIFPASTMTIAGEGPQLKYLQKLAKEHRIASAVFFPGFVSQSELRELFYSSH